MASITKMKQRTRIEQEKNYASYMQSQALLNAHHSNNARLVSIDSSWQIETCEQQLIVLTQELVAQMKHLKMLEQSLKQGDQIEIAFDQRGRILTIKARSDGATC
ncbi:hypothetical protein [Lacimicrobium alkaliphilum]|nr:hypothetical protein [Lacimicrobium alkaliphilum]